MAGKPGSKEEHAQAKKWAEKNVRSGSSCIVKWMKAHMPKNDDDEEHF